MADTKISADSDVGTLDGTELVPVVSGGANGRTTTQDIADLGGGGSITPLVLEDANTVSQRNSANAQSFSVFNTWTSGTNFEAIKAYYSGNTAWLVSTKGSGGGTIRNIIIGADAENFTNAANVQIVSGQTGNTTLDGVLALKGTDIIAGWNIGTGAQHYDFVPGADNNISIGAAAFNVKHVYLRTLDVKPVAVASLPGSPTAGMIAAVNDATTPAVGSTVSAGGAAYAMVQYNGSAWKVLGI